MRSKRSKKWHRRLLIRKYHEDTARAMKIIEQGVDDDPYVTAVRHALIYGSAILNTAWMAKVENAK